MEQPVASEEHESRSLRIEEALAATMMGLLTLLTLANVITRYFGDVSLAFTEEISVFLIVLLTLFGAATAFARGRHLAITFVVDRLPGRLGRMVKALAQLCSIALFAVLGWYGALMFMDDWYSGMTSAGLGIPQWVYTVWLPIVSVAITLRLVIRFVRSRRAS